MKGDLVFAVPGNLDTPTGGYAYDRRMIGELRALGWEVEHVDLGEGFPQPSAHALEQASRKLTSLRRGVPVIVDGLAFGVMDGAAATLGERSPLIALVHHPLAYETGVTPDDAKRLRRSERAALAAAHHVLVTSQTTADLLSTEYTVPPKDITVARPGTDPVAPAVGSDDGIVRLLTVGSLVPRKGHDVLLAALATMAELPWRLTIAGARDRHAETVARLEADIARHGFADRVTVLGALPAPALARLYAEADIFVLASRYEGYGMAYAEAVAHGLPVIGTTAGAIPEAVPAGAGLLVPPDDVDALAVALRRLLETPPERERLRAGARAAACTLPTWRDSAELISRAIEAVR